MFCGEIESVSNTRILTGVIYPAQIVNSVDTMGRNRSFKKPIGDQLQFVCISNQILLTRHPVDAYGRSNTAMILPVPIRTDRENRIKIFTMDNYETIFEDLDSLFPVNNVIKPSKIADAVNIGSYLVSVVPDIDSLYSTDCQITPNMKDLLNQYYPKGFAFILCVLKSNAQYYPFGYCHELRKDGKLFIPTRHHYVESLDQKYQDSKYTRYREYNDKESESFETLVQDTLFMQDKYLRQKVNRDKTAQISRALELDWDHHVYIINREPNMHSINPVQNKFAQLYSYLNMTLFPREITFGGIKKLYKIRLTSKHPGNYDLYI